VTKPTTQQIASFRRDVLRAHALRGRHSLPWRQTQDPYTIAVSEIMLQQTQVERVIPKFNAWMKRFPTAKKLAAAPTADVLRLWQGLGYNRRAIALQKMAHAVVTEHAGTFPSDEHALIDLPGIGPYTAGAIRAFAFDLPSHFIETNIRTVLIHRFFPKARTAVTDARLIPLVAATLGTQSPRLWYSALMDYGAELKRELGIKKTTLHKKSAHYTKQSKFEGSKRQLRARIVRYALAHPDATKDALAAAFKESPHDVYACIDSLEKEGLLPATIR
jgi:A/G-specific adenine glycosylase